MPTIHVICVPYGMTADEAWAEVAVMGRMVEYRWWNWRFWPGFRQWAAIRVED